MKLYLVRHGEAVQTENDNERVLTKEGRERVEETAGFLFKNNVNVDIIYHSVKTRARETANIIAAKINPSGGIKESPDLKPNDPVRSWLYNAGNLKSDAMIVGHLPHLSKLVSSLTAGDENRDILVIGGASVACLEKTGVDNWSVLWFVNPDIL